LEQGKPGQKQIVDVAAALFAERGYANVSIRDVCKEAKTTPPMIYYYFKDKKALFEAAVSHRISMHEFILLLRARTDQPDERKGIVGFIDVYLSSFPVNAFDPGLYMRETAKLDDESAGLIVKQMDEVDEILSSTIRRGINKGVFRKTDPQHAADCLIGMMNRVIFQKIHFSRAMNISESKAFIADFFLRAMK
jgi:AcrR family transcriptional regulator